MTTPILGIFREVLHSPEREFDDYEILKCVGERLKEKGCAVTLQKPEEVLLEKEKWTQSPPRLIFMMCEQKKILEFLGGEEFHGIPIVNSPVSVFNTYRDKMVPLLQEGHIPFPKSSFVPTENFLLSNFTRPGKLWIKRGDVHNTQKNDVVSAESAEEIKMHLNDLRLRGIKTAVLQEHIQGDLIKFYGVGVFGEGGRNPLWFNWFYHKNQELKNHPFSEDELRKITRSAAQCMGLEIFGGDAIVTPKGTIFLIDINAWPSFALFREEASKHIADYLFSKTTGRFQKV